ncbi:MAG: Coenzyme F420 hydrogenase/dehydrogenase, beta subunit C-terminal domain [Syntrophales bacterium]|jgi:coenzyme F420 hydrogenase subunit beta
MTNIRTIKDVTSWRMCVGCGACAYICPNQKIKLIDVMNQGIRPCLSDDQCDTCDDCLKVCPGYETIHDSYDIPSGAISTLRHLFGPILEVWEGYAANKDIRYNGSSGGLASALALYCIEEMGMHGVLHIDADPDVPWKNRTVLSQTRSDLIARTGSRYAPASPCDGLNLIYSAPSPSVFIGKPCDVAGLRKAQKLRPSLNQNIGAAIGIFCAGTPSSLGTLELLKYYKIDPNTVSDIRYRGKGWPGMFQVHLKGNNSSSFYKSSYKESWGFLNRYRPFRCYLCPDGTSEFADISCGDPWYRELKEDELGYSLLLVRTARGQEIVRGALKTGYVVIEKSDPQILHASQENLLLKRGAIWGRLLAMRAFGLPTPKLQGFSLFSNWCALPLLDQAKSILGTIRRVMKRKYYRPIENCEGRKIKS